MARLAAEHTHKHTHARARACTKSADCAPSYVYKLLSNTTQPKTSLEVVTYHLRSTLKLESLVWSDAQLYIDKESVPLYIYLRKKKEKKRRRRKKKEPHPHFPKEKQKWLLTYSNSTNAHQVHGRTVRPGRPQQSLHAESRK